MPRNKLIEEPKEEKKKATRKARAVKLRTPRPKKSEQVELPRVVVQEVCEPKPVTRSWLTVLSDGAVYKTTTTVMNRAVLVSSIAVYIIAFVIAGMSVFAAPPPPVGAPEPFKTELTKAAAAATYSGTGGEAMNIGIIAAQLLKFFFGALGLLFVGYIFYAGFQWLTAAGDEKKVASARGIIFHSIIGLLVCVASFSISSAWLSAIGSAVRP